MRLEYLLSLRRAVIQRNTSQLITHWKFSLPVQFEDDRALQDLQAHSVSSHFEVLRTLSNVLVDFELTACLSEILLHWNKWL